MAHNTQHTRAHAHVKQHRCANAHITQDTAPTYAHTQHSTFTHLAYLPQNPQPKQLNMTAAF